MGALIKAYDNYLEGVRGQGVKVAIIDGGFKGVRTNYLETCRRVGGISTIPVKEYTLAKDVHGTACAEIVHDVAPEAELYFYKVGDLVDLQNAKDRSIRDSIDVISHSIGWFGTGIGDGRGIACDICK